MSPFLLCFINAMMLVIGQLMFKYGVKGRDFSSLPAIIKILFSPIIFSALVLYAMTTVLWLYILNRTDLSYAYPIQSLAIPTVLILSALIFHETIPSTRWLGAAIIYLGIFIAVR